MLEARLFKYSETNYFFVSEKGDCYIFSKGDSLIPLEKEEIVPSLFYKNEVTDPLLICYFSQLLEIESTKRELIEKILKF